MCYVIFIAFWHQLGRKFSFHSLIGLNYYVIFRVMVHVWMFASDVSLQIILAPSGETTKVAIKRQGYISTISMHFLVIPKSFPVRIGLTAGFTNVGLGLVMAPLVPGHGCLSMSTKSTSRTHVRPVIFRKSS